MTTSLRTDRWGVSLSQAEAKQFRVSRWREFVKNALTCWRNKKRRPKRAANCSELPWFVLQT